MRPLLTLTWIGALLAFSTHLRADMYSDVDALVRSGQWQKAQALASVRLQAVPTDPQMRLLQSHIQVGLGQSPAAMQTLKALTQSFPELAEPHNNLAVLLAQENRHEEALESLQAAIKARPDYALALENLGDTYLALAARAYAQAQKSGATAARLQGKKLASEQALKTP
jgi:tetratricopeptide (TPR) repeat protein